MSNESLGDQEKDFINPYSGKVNHIARALRIREKHMKSHMFDCLDPQVQETVVAMYQAGVSLETIGNLLGIKADNVSKYFKEQLEAVKHIRDARVTNTLYEKATVEKDLGAIIWWQKGVMKLTEKKEIDINANIKIEFNATISKPPCPASKQEYIDAEFEVSDDE